MALTDIFTGAPALKAGQDIRKYLGDLQSGVNTNLGGAQASGLGALQSGQYGALGALGPAFTAGQNYVSSYTPQALDFLMGQSDRGATALQGAIDPALATLQGGVASAANAYAPVTALANRFSAAGGQAGTASADALGLNGPEGIARAQQSFQAGPGYNFAVDQGLNAITRAANAGGMVAGGNTLRESQTFGQGLANQEWQKYLANLQGQQSLYEPLAASTLGAGASGAANAYLTGGTGGANIYTGTAGRLADLSGATGRTGAGILSGAGGSLADLVSKGGLAESNVFQQGGQNAADLYRQFAGLQTGLAGQLAGPYTDTYKMGAAAQQTGSGQLWDLIGNAAKFGAGTGLFGPAIQSGFAALKPTTLKIG